MADKVKAMVFNGPESLEWREFDKPTIRENDGLLRIDASGICGSDHEFYYGVVPLKPPVILGHEPFGTIVEIGKVARERQSRLDLASDFPQFRGLKSVLTREVHKRQLERMLRNNREAAEQEAKKANEPRRRQPNEAAARAAAFVRAQVKLRSVGGDGVHGWVEACPSARELQMTDSEC